MGRDYLNRQRMVRILIIAGAVAAGVLIQQIFFNPSTDEQLEKTASMLNKKCPVMIDKETRLENAAVLPGRVFQYNFTLVNMVVDSINIKAFDENMKPLVLKSVKTNPRYKAYMKREVTISYAYSDKNGKYISVISVTPDMYKGK
jgi:hypothetical protein